MATFQRPANAKSRARNICRSLLALSSCPCDIAGACGEKRRETDRSEAPLQVCRMIDQVHNVGGDQSDDYSDSSRYGSSAPRYLVHLECLLFYAGFQTRLYPF